MKKILLFCYLFVVVANPKGDAQVTRIVGGYKIGTSTDSVYDLVYKGTTFGQVVRVHGIGLLSNQDTLPLELPANLFAASRNVGVSPLTAQALLLHKYAWGAAVVRGAATGDTSIWENAGIIITDSVGRVTMLAPKSRSIIDKLMKKAIRDSGSFVFAPALYIAGKQPLEAVSAFDEISARVLVRMSDGTLYLMSFAGAITHAALREVILGLNTEFLWVTHIYGLDAKEGPTQDEFMIRGYTSTGVTLFFGQFVEHHQIGMLFF